MNRKATKTLAIPEERQSTIRRYITSLLAEHRLTAREMAKVLRIPESDVSDHLEHIRKTMHNENLRLLIVPAECESCGFVFRKRERLSKPSKCPTCRSINILPQLFSIDRKTS